MGMSKKLSPGRRYSQRAKVHKSRTINGKRRAVENEIFEALSKEKLSQTQKAELYDTRVWHLIPFGGEVITVMEK